MRCFDSIKLDNKQTHFSFTLSKFHFCFQIPK